MNGVETRPVFFPLHVMPPYKAYAAGQNYTNSTTVSEAGLSLPSAVALKPEDLEKVCSAVREILQLKSLTSSHGIGKC
jgi:perosamine synthetase